MAHTPRHRLACPDALQKNARISFTGNAAHYLTHVLRLKAGDAVLLFNGKDGEWRAHIHDVRKKEVVLLVEAHRRAPLATPDMWVCFAPVKGGRLETIIEKATELGAARLQPVITARTIVDKVNPERAEAIAREAAEQCERTDWPGIMEPVKLLTLLGGWPKERVLIYGDESGASGPVTALTGKHKVSSWAVLTGPEGGFTPEELEALRRVQGAHGVGLGPRILRADTAAVTLSALTAAAWGDWSIAPHVEGTVA